MDTTRHCPECHQPLSADAPDGLCPQCLMRAAAGPPPNASSDGLPGDIIDIGDPAEVAKKLPQFEILELLGRGGMGVVYKARQLQLDRIIALKILPPVDALSADFVARFTREARALGKLNHPNIVAVYDFGETGGLYYIVMEFVDGANLRQLQETRRLTPVEALAIVPKICDALQYAHEEGLVHRDIKPENLLIDKKGRIKIADFGLAKMLRREPLDMTLTLSGMALGTMRYMAPEQMDKPETVDHRADIYSLGVVIYEMLTGQLPTGHFELPSQKAQVDPRLDGIVLHALEHDVERRYQHASEVRDDVERVTSKPQTGPVAEPRPASTIAADPKRANEAQPVALGPLPRFFKQRCFGALMLGWVVVAALWNLGVTGFLLGAFVMAAIVKQIGRTYANRDPRFLEELRSRGPVKRFTILFVSLLSMVLVFIMFLSGWFMLWDSFAMHEKDLAPSSEQFEAKYKGKEYQLLRQLTAFKDQAPAVDLNEDIIGASSSGHLPAPMVWLFFIGGLWMLVAYFQLAAGELLPGSKGRRRPGWRAAFSCIGIFLASMVIAFTAIVWLFLLHSNGRKMNFAANAVIVPAKINQVSNALHHWASENGYDSADNRWMLQTVPSGKHVASAEVFQAWKESPFKRWQMTAFGPERPFPHLAVQTISSESPVESLVTISTPGWFGGMFEAGSAKDKQWQAIVQSLSDAVSKAPDFNPGLISVMKPEVKHGETDPVWRGVCVMLAAMLVWVVITIRYLTPVTVTPNSTGQTD